jgi:hypothetical protein
MKKKLLILIMLTTGFIGVQAQAPSGLQFGGGVRLGLPVGDFSDTHGFGAGAEIQCEYGFSENFSGIATTGFTNFFGKKVDVLGQTVKWDGIGFIPFLAGVRYYASSNVFIGAQAGYGIITGNNSDGAFNYQPQAGYNSSTFQVTLNYNVLTKQGSTLGHIGATAIIKFSGSGSN